MFIGSGGADDVPIEKPKSVMMNDDDDKVFWL
jgi:hypothetical protein